MYLVQPKVGMNVKVTIGEEIAGKGKVKMVEKYKAGETGGSTTQNLGQFFSFYIFPITYFFLTLRTLEFNKKKLGIDLIYCLE